MTPTTPKGTLTLRMVMPFGRRVSLRTLPRGDGSPATFSISDAMPSIRWSVSFRRSYLGLSGLMRERSQAFASMMSSVASRRLPATERSISDTVSSETCCKERCALEAFSSMSFTIMMVSGSGVRYLDSLRSLDMIGAGFAHSPAILAVFADDPADFWPLVRDFGCFRGWHIGFSPTRP